MNNHQRKPLRTYRGPRDEIAVVHLHGVEAVLIGAPPGSIDHEIEIQPTFEDGRLLVLVDLGSLHDAATSDPDVRADTVSAALSRIIALAVAAVNDHLGH